MPQCRLRRKAYYSNNTMFFWRIQVFSLTRNILPSNHGGVINLWINSLWVMDVLFLWLCTVCATCGQLVLVRNGEKLCWYVFSSSPPECVGSRGWYVMMFSVTIHLFDGVSSAVGLAFGSPSWFWMRGYDTPTPLPLYIYTMLSSLLGLDTPYFDFNTLESSSSSLSPCIISSKSTLTWRSTEMHDFLVTTLLPLPLLVRNKCKGRLELGSALWTVGLEW